jgi:hypothetical protein
VKKEKSNRTKLRPTRGAHKPPDRKLGCVTQEMKNKSRELVSNRVTGYRRTTNARLDALGLAALYLKTERRLRTRSDEKIRRHSQKWEKAGICCANQVSERESDPSTGNRDLLCAEWRMQIETC